MKLFHISHTDLDGYACQLLTKELFKEGTFYNANYGLEVKLTLQKAVEEIKKLQNEEILFLISDINLMPNEAKDLDKEIRTLNSEGHKIKLQLLDHHITGQKCADKYEWYFLDTKRSATKIVYDYLLEEYKEFNQDECQWLLPLVEAVNAVDIWLENETNNFEFGKVLMRMVSQANEINSTLFANENREYRLWLIKKAAEFVDKENNNILLDDNIHFMKKEYLKINDESNTIDNLSANNLVRTLEGKKEELTIFYKKHKGLLTYSLGSISIPANAFLKANSDYDFFIDISKRGMASFRAANKVDVSQMAQKLCNGGGHPNAAGAKFDDFTETINYNDVKNYIQEKLNSIS